MSQWPQFQAQLNWVEFFQSVVLILWHLPCLKYKHNVRLAWLAHGRSDRRHVLLRLSVAVKLPPLYRVPLNPIAKL